MEYLVSWKIDIEADSHEEAAQAALDILRETIYGDACASVLEIENRMTNEVEQINWEDL